MKTATPKTFIEERWYTRVAGDEGWVPVNPPVETADEQAANWAAENGMQILAAVPALAHWCDGPVEPKFRLVTIAVTIMCVPVEQEDGHAAQQQSARTVRTPPPAATSKQADAAGGAGAGGPTRTFTPVDLFAD